MTTAQIAPYLPDLLILDPSYCKAVPTGLYVRYHQYEGELFVYGNSRADWEDVIACIERFDRGFHTLIGPVVRCEIFHVPENCQLTATVWDDDGNKMLQIGDVSKVFIDLMNHLSVQDDVKEAAKEALFQRDENVIVFRAGHGLWAHFVVPEAA
jgi:hypothetical protein